MIFDAVLTDGVVSLRCVREDYFEDPTFYKNFVLVYKPGKDEGDDRIPTLDSGPWHCEDHEGGLTVPPWAQRLAKVLEPRIQAMLLTGQPANLRRWIDDEVLDAIETELANRNDRLPANV